MSELAAKTSEHRERILAIFEKHREDPGLAFPEEGFLNHLMARPRGPETVRNSFSGLRRFNRFIEDVQLEFGVCFSVNDLEKIPSLPRFVAMVQELEESPRSSMTSLKNQIRAGPGWGVFVFGNFILVASAVALRGSSTLFVIVTAVAAFANIAVFEFYRRGRMYHRRLTIRIQLHSDESNAV